MGRTLRTLCVGISGPWERVTTPSIACVLATTSLPDWLIKTELCSHRNKPFFPHHVHVGGQHALQPSGGGGGGGGVPTGQGDVERMMD